MSIPSVVKVFEPGVSASPTGLLEALIRQHLDSAAREIAASEGVANDVRESGAATMSVGHDKTSEMKTIIGDMGEYLTQAAQILSCLTDKLVDGSHVETAVLAAHEQSRIQTNVSDLTTVVHMDVQHSRLCKIRDLTEKFSREVQEVWRPDPGAMIVDSPCPQTAFSPFRDPKRSPLTRFTTTASDVDVKVHGQKMLPSSQPSLSQASPTGDASGTDSSEEDEEEQFSRIDMDALKQRGKGSYYCPLGHRCDKGGVDKAGNLVLFDRNSSFAQHCNKHRKPWRCEVPGCPNPPKKRRFARRDGLERHKATVKHYIVK